MAYVILELLEFFNWLTADLPRPLILGAPTFLAAYLLGSLAFSVIACRALGLPDPRTVGSGNAGATNVLRSGNRVAALATLLGDVLKGLLAICLARSISHNFWVVGAAMVGVVFGHLYPIFFRFKGGKGVATSMGVLTGLYWVLGLSVVLLWLLALAFTRRASAASLVAALAAPVLGYYVLMPEWLWPISILSLLQIWKHRANLWRLCQGTEPKISFIKK